MMDFRDPEDPAGQYSRGVKDPYTPRKMADYATNHGRVKGSGTSGETCGDPKSPEASDWSQGEPAFAIRDKDGQLTYLAQPCEPETHLVTLAFVRDGAAWQLSQRSVRMGRR